MHLDHYTDELSDALNGRGCQSEIDWLFGQILTATGRRSRVFIAGNGGSASTASHMACDFQKWAHELPKNAERVAAISLSDNTAIMSAVGNDTGFENVFTSQLEALAVEGDILIVISVSGNSPNVVRAIDIANERHLVTFALTGMDGGEAAVKADKAVIIPSKDYGIVEDCHAIIMHVLTRMLRERYGV